MEVLHYLYGMHIGAGSRVFYLSAYPTESGPPDAVKVNLKPAPRLRKTEEEIHFKDVAIRGRSSGGNIVTKHSVRNVVRLPKAARENDA